MSRDVIIARQFAAIGVTAQSVSLDASEYFRLLDPANIGELETLAAAHPEFRTVLAMAREDAEAMRKPPPVDPPLGAVEISCDGFCCPNSGGAMGAVAVLTCAGKMREASEGYSPAPDHTNNRAELLAAILGLRTLIRPCRATAFTDSQFLVQGFETWRRRERPERINADLWVELDLATDSHSVSIEWLSGRDPRIVRADELARHAAMPHLAPKARDAMRSYDDALARGLTPGPLYPWLLRNARRANG
jgi:ribonuclease HI